MERWFIEMGFKPEDIDEISKQFKMQCHPSMKIVWKHVIKHIRPKSEAEIIRKQCLLYKLRTSKHNEKIQVPLSCLKQYNDYLKFKRDDKNLKAIQNEITKKKASLEEHLSRLELLRARSMKEEEELKEKVYKLSQLKKKKVTILRLIGKLVYSTKLLQIISEDPEKFVGFGTNVTDWERQVLMTVKELPSGFKYQTILMKLRELLHESKLVPIPFWDRTELLTSMEEMLINMNEKLSSCLKNFNENLAHLEETKHRISLLIQKQLDTQDIEYNITELLDNCHQDVMNIAEEVSKDLSEDKSHYKLDVQLNSVRMLQSQINEKINEIISMLPVECEPLNNSQVEEPLTVDLPPTIPIERLHDSLSNEVSVFMKMPLYSRHQNEERFQYIRSGCTSESQYYKLKCDIKKLMTLLSINNTISSLTVQSKGSISIGNSKRKNYELCATIQTCEELANKIKKTHARVKAAFYFLRKEPLNEKLTGIEVGNEDSRYWLNAYSTIKERLDHEEWLLRDSKESNDPDSD